MKVRQVFNPKTGIIGIILLGLLLSTIAYASIDVYFSLVDNPEKAIIEQLNQAKESIDIAMCYFTDRELANAVIEAHNRGVRVRVYLDKDQKEAKYSKSRYLAKHGIAIRYSDNPYIMHHKFCVIDNEVVITGSYNWTASAGERNNENLLVIRDPPLANRYEQEFNRLWNEHYLTEEGWEVPAQEIKPLEQKPQAEKVVYITKTGKKYHRAGCRYLKRSMIPITLSEAIARGYTPCSVCKPDPLVESSQGTEWEMAEKPKEVFSDNENYFWSTNFREFLKLYQLKKSELTGQEFEKWKKECVGKKVKWTGLIQKLEHFGNKGVYIVEIQTHLGIDIEGKIREEPYGWKLVVEMYSREIKLRNVSFLGPTKVKVEEKSGGKYDYLPFIGTATGVVIWDRRSGDIWFLYEDPATEKIASEYFGNIEEFIKRKKKLKN